MKKNLTYNSFLFRKCYRHNGSELNDQFYILACRLQRLQDNKKEQKNFMHGTLQEFLFLFKKTSPANDIFFETKSSSAKVKYGNNKYATIGSVERFLMILAEPGIFGVCCNVWPDPN